MTTSGDEGSLEEILQRLPPDRRAAVEAFARFLLREERRAGHEDRRLSLSWAGGLRHLRDEWTSEDLEAHALDLWREQRG